MAGFFGDRIDAAADGRIDLRPLPARPGVYLIRDASGAPLLLSAAANMRRIVGGRLAPPPPEERRRRTDLSEIAASVEWMETFSRFESLFVHWLAARSVYPRGYREQLLFPPCFFIRVDPEHRTPRFEVTASMDTSAARYFGPIPSRRDALAWIALLEDAFDLCRYHEVLAQAPRGQACAYFDMGKCPAPCNGTIPLDAYRGMIQGAIDFTLGHREMRLTALRALMRRQSDAMQFERAAATKRSLEAAESLPGKPAYQHMADACTTRWLVIERFGRPARDPNMAAVRPYVLGCGGFTGLPYSRLPELDRALPGWLEALAVGTHERANPVARGESFWLLSRFLFGSQKPSGLIFRADRLPPTDALLHSIQDCFKPHPASSPTSPNEEGSAPDALPADDPQGK